MTAKLFSPLNIRKQTFKNRIGMAPMCMYSAVDGVANNWHLVHLGARASGGAAVIIAEATGVVMEGRISEHCLALCNESQRDALIPITEFIKSQNCIPAIQLAHSGRKGEGPWDLYAPSAIAFSDKYRTPRELKTAEVYSLVNSFAHSAKLALSAGFEIVELHMAHGYLMHQFLSPLTNHRNDEFGGSLENRMRFPLLVAKAVRDLWPSDKALFARISATDYTHGGWDIDQSVILCQELKKIGVDLIDVSSGGNVATASIPVKPGYQVEFAREIKQKAGIMTGAVGLITEAHQAEEILEDDRADLIFLGRELLRDPYFAINAAIALNVRVDVPRQYQRAYLS